MIFTRRFDSYSITNKALVTFWREFHFNIWIKICKCDTKMKTVKSEEHEVIRTKTLNLISGGTDKYFTILPLISREASIFEFKEILQIDPWHLTHTHLDPGTGPEESGLCCSELQQNTHSFECESWCWIDVSGGQVEMVVSPLSSGLAVMFPTQRGFRGTDSLLCLLILIHSRAHTYTHTHTHTYTHTHHDQSLQQRTHCSRTHFLTPHRAKTY